MNKCPFIAVCPAAEQGGATPPELRECLGAACEIFDPAAGKCSLPGIEARIRRLEELQRALQEDASHALLAEIRETRENTAATLIHVLRKVDASNELLGRIADHAPAAGGAGGDVSALLSPLVEMKEALAISQTKFSDILELILEDQQQRAMQSHAAAPGGAAPTGAAPVDLAPLAAPLAEIREALAASNAKFTDILELLLEEQQQRAARGGLPADTNAPPAATGAVDLAPLQSSLAELKDAIIGGNAKFGDLLELMLEEQQQRASQEDGAVGARIDLAPLQSGLSEMKDALNLSQAKFSDILELMLEEQQRKAAEGAAVAAALDKLGQKQEQLFAVLAQQLQASAGSQGGLVELKTDLAAMAGAVEQAVSRLADAENQHRGGMEEAARRLAEMQSAMLALLESQRGEQAAAAEERRLRQSDEHNEKGVMLYHRREPGAAEAEFRRAIELRPDFAEAYNNLGLALSDQNKKEEAVAAFRKAVELLPDAPETYNNLGCLFKMKKDYQQAVEHFNQAIAKRADYAPGYFNLGLAYEEMEKYDPAIKAWEKVLALQPTHDEARRKIATYRARKA